VLAVRCNVFLFALLLYRFASFLIIGSKRVTEFLLLTFFIFSEQLRNVVEEQIFGLSSLITTDFVFYS